MQPNFVTVSDHRYIWSGNTIAEERDTVTNAVTKRFFDEGEQINGTNYYFTRDHLGSIREMTNSAGALVARYEYDPYGNAVKISGTVDADFGFTGLWYHRPLSGQGGLSDAGRKGRNLRWSFGNAAAAERATGTLLH